MQGSARSGQQDLAPGDPGQVPAAYDVQRAALIDLLERGDLEAAAAELTVHLEHAETSMLTALHLA